MWVHLDTISYPKAVQIFTNSLDLFNYDNLKIDNYIKNILKKTILSNGLFFNLDFHNYNICCPNRDKSKDSIFYKQLSSSYLMKDNYWITYRATLIDGSEVIISILQMECNLWKFPKVELQKKSTADFDSINSFYDKEFIYQIKNFEKFITPSDKELNQLKGFTRVRKE
jgi:hypothetical protein